ncbi:hypothetical protein PYCCODRAFT_918011 [Trametes coccinea BRFM310]|uniref:Uncharacterized protein n=1 Tax=Trametes coccinea (strain BRFM310) TaxID=1353009 RepID=A0A1Y2IEQ3_TRAC3|nr:hypothetical protein PYCCODRAFT_918011 [Trametes coccinea BRFM310]
MFVHDAYRPMDAYAPSTTAFLLSRPLRPAHSLGQCPTFRFSTGHSCTKSDAQTRCPGLSCDARFQLWLILETKFYHRESFVIFGGIQYHIAVGPAHLQRSPPMTLSHHRDLTQVLARDSLVIVISRQMFYMPILTASCISLANPLPAPSPPTSNARDVNRG